MKVNKTPLSLDQIESSSTANFVQHSSPQREQMISDAAYFRAEKRGFQPLNDVEDWLDAEADIDRHLI
jgi:hypothetical protein